MNDEFLYQLRKKPRREFAVRLKGRLDRQASGTLVSRRSTFVRSLAIALLVGGAAFAVTTVSMYGLPTLVLDWVHAPGTVVPVNPGSETAERREAPDPRLVDQRQARKAADRLAPEAAKPSVASGRPAERQTGAGERSSEGKAGPASMPERSTGAAALPASRSRVGIVGTADSYPYTESILERFGSRLGDPIVEVQTPSEAAVRFCEGIGAQYPDILVRFGRMSPAEAQACDDHGIGDVLEFEIGYEGIVLARSPVYGALELSTRALFLALAKQIPDPRGSQTLIQNRNRTWNQVDPTLGYDAIEVIGPPLASIPGKSFLALALEAGCDTFPWIAALRDTDETRHTEICRTLRDDRGYLEMTEGFAFTQRLETYPAVLGVLSYGYYATNRDKLVGGRLSGVEPTLEAIRSGAYPGARTLYLYLKKADMRFIGGLPALVDAYLVGAMSSRVLTLDEDEWRANRARIRELERP